MDNSKWLSNIAALLKSALTIVNAIDIEERPVLVHCSDGWDRTPQIIALAELMLDPYYRTMDGFQVLIEKEWIEVRIHNFDFVNINISTIYFRTNHLMIFSLGTNLLTVVAMVR